jgi:murein L,D-transpeptidase YcbB/YkuD
MRKIRIELLAATAVSLIVPVGGSEAAPRILTTPPPPAAINDYAPRNTTRTQPPAYVPTPTPRAEEPRFEAPPLPAPAPVVREQQYTPPPVAQTPPPVTPAPMAQSPAPAPQAAEPSIGTEIKSAIDRLFAASDSQITDRLRAMATGKQFEKVIARQPERTAAENFYKARNYAPLWIKDGRLTERAKTVIARLKNASADALDSADYPVPEFGTFTGADALAEGDLRLTNSVLDYARHLSVGRIAPTRVSAEVDYGNRGIEPGDVLRQVAAAGDIDSTIESFNPPHAGFKALKAKLAAVRANASVAEPGPARIPDGPAIQVGKKDPRVPQLRDKLGIKGAKPDDTTYDAKLAKAIALIQQKNGIHARGEINNRTIDIINGPKLGDPSQAIAANMERWRWLPRDLGRTYVMVNIPDYTLRVVKDGSLVWRTKIVAGKPQTPTPLLSASMNTVIVNPSWYVPQSIIQNELLPQYERDPLIFERMGLEVKRGPDGNINVVQPPGAANALGRIKFNFPNKFQVYLHDTPEKRLFSHERRAFSHGCMRVEDPTKFGEVMLSLAMAGPMPNSSQILQMFGHEEKIFTLQQQPRVHLTYQTAYVDDSGRLIQREDLYGFDARIHAILNTDERKVADVAPPQDKQREAALTTAKTNQEILRRVERREARNPFAFFERIFR